MPEGVKNMARHECITCLKTCSKCNILEVFANALRVQRVSGFDGVEESLEEVKVTFVEKHRVADVVARRERKLLLLMEGKRISSTHIHELRYYLLIMETTCSLHSAVQAFQPKNQVKRFQTNLFKENCKK